MTLWTITTDSNSAEEMFASFRKQGFTGRTLCFSDKIVKGADEVIRRPMRAPCAFDDLPNDDYLLYADPNTRCIRLDFDLNRVGVLDSGFPMPLRCHTFSKRDFLNHPKRNTASSSAVGVPGIFAGDFFSLWKFESNRGAEEQALNVVLVRAYRDWIYLPFTSRPSEKIPAGWDPSLETDCCGGHK